MDSSYLVRSDLMWACLFLSFKNSPFFPVHVVADAQMRGGFLLASPAHFFAGNDIVYFRRREDAGYFGPFTSSGKKRKQDEAELGAAFHHIISKRAKWPDVKE